MSNIFLFSFAANDSLSFHVLGIVNAAAVHVCGVGVWAGVFHGLLVSQILWDWNCHMTSSVPFFESKALWQCCPWMFWWLIYHQWHIRYPFTNTALLFLVYRVLDNGLFHFSVVILHCSLIFHITDKKGNEVHFQRFLSKHWLVFSCLSFLSDRMVCSCFYFSMRPLAIL